MATHVDIKPLHEGTRVHAGEILRKLEAHLDTRAERIEDGYRFEFDDDDFDRNASNLTRALDFIASDWRDHISMGL